MKILLVISPEHKKIISIYESLIELGCEVQMIEISSFSLGASYISKKLDEIGWSYCRKKYIQQQFYKLHRAILDGKPDCVLFINAFLHVFSATIMKKIRCDIDKVDCKLYSWLVDPLDNINENYYLFDIVFSYEKRDSVKLEKLGIKSRYVPVGYQPIYAQKYKEDNIKRCDIVFVGTPYKRRVQYLDRIAKSAHEENWNFKVFGVFYNKRHFWKKIKLYYQYPDLYSCVENGFISSRKTAEIYRNSRIVLNIHGNRATSCNPRTYDILASGAFELIDNRENYDILEPGKDLDVFMSEDDLLKKIKYYLLNSKKRIEIASHGREKVIGKRSICNSMQLILDSIRG